MALPSIKNSVGMAVSAVADSGQGTLTVGAALSGGYQTAGSAHGANAVSDFRFEEGDLWETAIDCAYDHTAGTVSRGTQTGGSSGPSTRTVFTTAAKVYEILDETRIRRSIGGYLEHASHDGSAAVTGVVGTLHVFTGLTADRTFTLPASSQAGDRIGITFPAGSADYEILLKSASGDKINNVDCSSTEWSRLFIAGETVIFRCIDASTVDWIVEYDGRIPCSCAGSGTYTHTSTSASQLIDLSGISVDKNIGSIIDSANDQILPRRAGNYLVLYRAVIVASGTGKRLSQSIYKSATDLGGCHSQSSDALAIGGLAGSELAIAVGDYITFYAAQNDSTSEAVYYRVSVTEIL